MTYMLFLLAAVLFTLPVICFTCHELNSAEDGIAAGLRCLITPGKNLAAVWIAGVGGGFALAAVSYRIYGGDCWHYVKLLFAYDWLISAAYLDGKTRRIPNRWILYGLAAWAAFCLLEGKDNGHWARLLWQALSGALLGGGIFMAGSLLRRGGMGMGDVKLYLVLGLMTGPQGVFNVLLIALVCALVYSLIMMAAGRVGRKDRIPIGPFTLLAMVAAILAGL